LEHISMVLILTRVFFLVVGLAYYQGKEIVLRFIIEYSS
jgi:hypothetical protein